MKEVNALHKLLCADIGKVTNEDAIIQEIRQNPNAAELTYTFSNSWETTTRPCHPLHQAIKLRTSLKVVEAIYDSFPPAINQTYREDTPLHLAVLFESPPDVILFVLHQRPEAAEHKNSYDQTPLHLACVKRLPLEVVRPILNAWPGASKEKSADEFLPLHEACNNHAPLDVMACVLKSWPGAIKEKCHDSSLPLHGICNGGELEKVALILNSWPDAVREKDSDGLTPLHIACSADALPNVILLLLEKWPEAATVKNNEEESPIDTYDEMGSSEVVSTVLFHISKLCGNGPDDDNVSSSSFYEEMMSYFIEINWFGGVALTLDWKPSLFQSLLLKIETKILPHFLFVLALRCKKITTLWHVVLNKQDILADL